MSRSLLATFVATFALVFATSATAQESVDAAPAFNLASASAAAPALDSWAYERPASTPRVLKALYGSYGVLQGLDIYSTSVALKAGAREANPLMDTHVGHAVALKAVMGLSTYYAVNKLSKKNRKAAVMTMVILNGVTAAIVANNMKNSRR